MRRFRKQRTLTLSPARQAKLARLFAGTRADDDQTLATIRRLYETTGLLVDPHTAVALAGAAAERGDPTVPMITVATAHPAKFPDAVERATGLRPALPPRLADLMQRPERVTVLPNDRRRVQDLILEHVQVAA